MGIDYTTVTELPGTRATSEQLAMNCHRYYTSSSYCKDKDVLEVACGAGQGLGYLANTANKVVGGDIDRNILRFAKEHYKGKDNIEIHLLDAHKLPFEDGSMDVVILLEAIYYLNHPEKFVEEAYRVLRNDGVLIICTVNKDWSDFNPSPYSIKYFSAPELYQLLHHKFPHVELYGAFETTPGSVTSKVISFIRRMAVALRLIPKTMKGKELFKRIFFGKLVQLPPEIKDGMIQYSSPVPIAFDSPNFQYKVFYAVALKC